MHNSDLITPQHLTRKAVIYIRQSTPHQVVSHHESLRLQYALGTRARQLGWPIGSMSARVAKARDLLHRRLAERRNGAQALLLPLTLLDHLGTAEVPVALMKSTLQAAAHVSTGTGAAAAVSPQVHDLAQATLQTLSSASRRWLLRFAAALALALGLSGAAYAVASDWSWPTSLFSSAPPANAAPSENPDGASCSNSSCCH